MFREIPEYFRFSRFVATLQPLSNETNYTVKNLLAQEIENENALTCLGILQHFEINNNRKATNASCKQAQFKHYTTLNKTSINNVCYSGPADA